MGVEVAKKPPLPWTRPGCGPAWPLLFPQPGSVPGDLINRKRGYLSAGDLDKRRQLLRGGPFIISSISLRTMSWVLRLESTSQKKRYSDPSTSRCLFMSLTITQWSSITL